MFGWLPGDVCFIQVSQQVEMQPLIKSLQDVKEIAYNLVQPGRDRCFYEEANPCLLRFILPSHEASVSLLVWLQVKEFSGFIIGLSSFFPNV